MAPTAKKKAPPPSFLDAVDKYFPDALGRGTPEGAAWRVVEKAIFATPLDETELETYRRLTGRTVPHEHPVREAWVIAGRQSGKSTLASMAAVYCAAFRDYRKLLTPGARGSVLILASDQRQSKRLLGLVNGILDSHPELKAMVESRTAESVSLRNRIDVVVLPADYRRVRSYMAVACVADECAAWWNAETSACPDTEVLGAVRGGMLRVPNSLLLCITSPLAKRGTPWDAYREGFGNDDSPILVVNSDSRTLNPSIPQAEVDAAYARDPAMAEAEIGGKFREDVGAYVRSETLDAATLKGQTVIAPERGKHFAAFFDAASGSGQDSAALGIACVESATLCYVREWRPPFSPAAVVAEAAKTVREYRCSTVMGDRWAKGLRRRNGRASASGTENATVQRPTTI